MEHATRLFLIRAVQRAGPGSDAEPRALAALEPALARIAERRPVLVVGSPLEPWLPEIARRIGAPLRCDPRLGPSSGPLAADGTTRVLTVLDELARELGPAEVVVFLHAEGIRAALARALNAADARVFAPEPARAIALDWAHPEAREFQHALIGVAFDWDIGPVAQRAHRFPGGASVLPRSS